MIFNSKNFYYVIGFVTFLYMGSFLLISYDGSLSFLGSSTNFFIAMIKTFQGAGAIAIITTILIYFQSKIQSKQEKDKKVFDEKIKLFDSIIDTIQKYHQVDKNKKEQRPLIDKDERSNLFFLKLKLQLICNMKMKISTMI